MKCEKLKNYGDKVKKNLCIGKWLFILGILILGIEFILLVFEILGVTSLIITFALFIILIEAAANFIDVAEVYKERIRQKIVSNVFETMINNCKKDGSYTIYWNYRDNLVVFGSIDETEIPKLGAMFNQVISSAIKQTGLKIQFEIELIPKEKMSNA